MGNTLKDFVPTEGVKENPYEKFYLESNPFPNLQVLYEDKFIESEEFTEKTRGVLRKFYHDGLTNRLVYRGQNRGGKTHALLYLRYIINNYLFPQYHYLKAVYIKNPPDIKGGEKGTFHDTYREMMEAEGLGKIFFEKLVDKLSENALGGVSNQGWRPVKKAHIKEYLQENKISEDLSMCLDVWGNSTALKDLALKNLAWDWICGRKLTKDEPNSKLKVSKNIESSSHAIFMINEIIKCCRLVFHERFGICLFIDEFEELTKLPKRDRIRYLADIRNLLDSVPKGLILGLGIASFGWDTIAGEYTALKVRLHENIVDLKRLTGETEALIYAGEYLNWGRKKYCVESGRTLDNIKEKIEKIGNDPDYFPFTKQEITENFKEKREGVDMSIPGNFLEQLSIQIENKIRE